MSIASLIVFITQVTDAIHAKGSCIYVQLSALGRGARREILTREGNFPYVSASSKHLQCQSQTSRPLTIPVIRQFVQDFAQAARNAVEAGFDGVEIHDANGYLVDQFLQDVTNERTDEYGGSIQRRSRFGLKVVKAVVDAIGQDRTGIRLSPWGAFNDEQSDILSVFLTNLYKPVLYASPTRIY